VNWAEGLVLGALDPVSRLLGFPLSSTWRCIGAGRGGCGSSQRRPAMLSVTRTCLAREGTLTSWARCILRGPGGEVEQSQSIIGDAIKELPRVLTISRTTTAVCLS
jgi:hypothetical protein